MQLRDKTVLLCDCTGTMTIDGEAIRRGCGAGFDTPATYLCRGELRRFDEALKLGAPLLVACTQEAPFFSETRAEAGFDNDITFVNIRERAGWSSEGAAAGPKMAALLAEAALTPPPAPSVTLTSEGTALIYGRDERTIEVARKLADKLDCTVLLDDPADVLPPRLVDVPIFRGRVVAAKGHLGAFEVVVDGYAPARPSSRAMLEFDAPRDGAASRCDVIVDLSGRAALFPAPGKREGYLRVDPGDPAAVAAAVLAAAELSGEFEKPRYVAYEAALCAHGRNTRTGCTRCIDLCPTGAIVPAGDEVAIDPRVCAGCGACASVCPTGAVAYAFPAQAHVFDRLRALLVAYANAGGEDAVLLIHDARHGEEMIDAMARRGRGLPARVLPFALNEVTQVGLDLLLTALAWGCASIRVLADPGPREDRTGLAQQIGLAEAVMVGLDHGEGRTAVIDAADPDAVERALYDLPRRAPAARATFLAAGAKRGIVNLALQSLHDTASSPQTILPLPAGAPFGAVAIDTAGCTLCLSCVGACPTGALLDNPERPELRFVESACVQCGLCRTNCPEKVITLAPRLNFAAAAREAVTLKAEAPALCVRCGKPFGARGTVERVVAKLAGRHWMFKDGPAVDRIRMCEDCRGIVQSESALDPFAGPPRPLPRTTEDDLRERGKPPQR
ncbi:MAG: 4Fe-4S binding protein [Alphaproteobacteria bacterium]|nr:4Fe-4S binding protein [Alphaproteobacteria bacterium]